MTSSVTHFEIFGEEPARLAEFYRRLLGWQIEKAPGIDYWRIQTNTVHVPDYGVRTFPVRVVDGRILIGTE